MIWILHVRLPYLRRKWLTTTFRQHTTPQVSPQVHSLYGATQLKICYQICTCYKILQKTAVALKQLAPLQIAAKFKPSKHFVMPKVSSLSAEKDGARITHAHLQFRCMWLKSYWPCSLQKRCSVSRPLHQWIKRKTTSAPYLVKEPTIQRPLCYENIGLALEA